MALWAYAFQTVAALRTELSIQGTAIDPVVETCINEASEMVEQVWGRHVVSRGPLTEYHPRKPSTPDSGSLAAYAVSPGYGLYDPFSPTIPSRPELYLNEWPVISVTSLNEDPARAYGGGTLLVADTDYILTKPTGKLTRVAGGQPKSWVWSWRSVKVVYTAGYQNVQGSISNADPIPQAVMRVFHELVRWMIDQRVPGPRASVGLASMSDALGNRTFSGPAYVTPAMREALDNAGAMRGWLRGITGDRDA